MFGGSDYSGFAGVCIVFRFYKFRNRSGHSCGVLTRVMFVTARVAALAPVHGLSSRISVWLMVFFSFSNIRVDHLCRLSRGNLGWRFTVHIHVILQPAFSIPACSRQFFYHTGSGFEILSGYNLIVWNRAGHVSRMCADVLKWGAFGVFCRAPFWLVHSRPSCAQFGSIVDWIFGFPDFAGFNCFLSVRLVQEPF